MVECFLNYKNKAGDTGGMEEKMKNVCKKVIGMVLAMALLAGGLLG